MRLANMTIAELVSRRPEARDALAALGLGGLTTDEILAGVGRYLRLGAALAAKGLTPDDLAETLERAAGVREAELADYRDRQGELNLLALMPCPLKAPFERQLKTFLAGAGLTNFTYCVEGNANLQDDYYGCVPQFRDLAEIPDMVIAPGLNSFFSRPFAERFVFTGCFADPLPAGVNADFAGLDYKDPRGWYAMLSMNLLIMAVDRDRLDGAPVPRRWADLLDPALAGKVGLRGQGDYFCETLLMNIHKEHGLEGVRALGRSTQGAYHPAQIVKSLSAPARPDKPGPAVGVIPHFFAQRIAPRPSLEIVWPEDGAIVSPVFLLVKQGKLDALRPVAEFIAGPETGAAFAAAQFPSLHPAVDNGLPPGQAYKWVGWEYVWSRDVGQHARELQHALKAAIRPGAAGLGAPGPAACGLGCR